MSKTTPKARLLGATVQLAVAIDRGDDDLEIVNLRPLELDAKAFREFLATGLPTALGEIEQQVIQASQNGTPATA